ncbi:MAG TPA: hypothetical protein VIT44_10325 [Cyclobacteriaceae bacterium]
MLRFFRINDPYRLLGVLIILILIALPLWIDATALTWPELKSRVLGEAISGGKPMYIQVYDDTPPLTSVFFGLMDWLFGRSVFAWQFIAFLLIFFQASYFGIVLINNKAYEDNTYLPALIYGLLAFFSFDLFSFSPELLASTFLLFTINNLFKEIEFRIQRDDIVLKVGVSIGLASLLVFSYAAFLPAVIFLLAIFARITLRKAFILLSGFALPHAILIMLYFYWDSTPLLWQNFYLPNLYFTKHGLVSMKSLFILGLIPLTYFLFSLVMLNRVARFTRYQSQLLQVMFIWLAPCAMLIMLTRELTPHSFYVFLPILSYFISHYFLLIRRRWIAEIMLWCFLGGIIIIGTMGRYGRISGIDYSSLLTPSTVSPKSTGKKIMVLGDDSKVYLDHQLGGYFLNWNLSREVFEEADYFENIIIIDNAFRTDPPDVVIDQKELMNKVMERIPSLKNKYKREGNQYVKISN